MKAAVRSAEGGFAFGALRVGSATTDLGPVGRADQEVGEDADGVEAEACHDEALAERCDVPDQHVHAQLQTEADRSDRQHGDQHDDREPRGHGTELVPVALDGEAGDEDDQRPQDGQLDQDLVRLQCAVGAE